MAAGQDSRSCGNIESAKAGQNHRMDPPRDLDLLAYLVCEGYQFVVAA